MVEYIRRVAAMILRVLSRISRVGPRFLRRAEPDTRGYRQVSILAAILPATVESGVEDPLKLADAAVAAILEQKGEIASFVGRELLAVFAGRKGVRERRAVAAGYRLQELCPGTRTGLTAGPAFWGDVGPCRGVARGLIGEVVPLAEALPDLGWPVPVICSAAVGEAMGKSPGSYILLELDHAEVCGEPQRLYWPVRRDSVDTAVAEQIAAYREALQHYYSGDWPSAYDGFLRCSELLPAGRMRQRTRGSICPRGWDGIWRS
ncbi:hypothetical protein [Spirochaeta africana]|uniref:Uncharacterized protein n=1 Tax=Spirochaeta africana (strain ATCC 700263 / DSM 8902 / Z-7692) TaxID=889378 RepID=H9UMD6_SPIAZ|nr:hypothetical protein [Spirochaeta africana]AFG38679.1 hypothetical protein Spiaf_2653 [Spirochaeta africana DSM 8902]